MTKYQLLKTLIKDYEGFHEACSKMDFCHEARNFLESQYANTGICFYAKMQLQVDIYHEKWVEKYSEGRLFWHPTPESSSTLARVLEGIQYRINILRQELKITKP